MSSVRGLLREDFLQQIGEDSPVTQCGLTRILKTSGSLFYHSSDFFSHQTQRAEWYKSRECAEEGGEEISKEIIEFTEF